MRPTTPGARVELVLRAFPGQGAAKLVMVGIANHDGEGGSWPSLDTLAAYASVDRRHARRVIRDLEAAEWVTVQANQGGSLNTRADRRSNLYVIAYDRLEGLLDEGVHAPPRTGGPLDPDEGAPRRERGGVDARDEGAPRPPEGDHEQDGELDLELVAHEPDIGFDVFWRTYPRREGRGAAERAWAKARKRERAAVIVAGAARYATDPNRDPAFTAHPSTWLNQDRWTDEPLPSKRRSRPEGPASTLSRLRTELAGRPDVGTVARPPGGGAGSQGPRPLQQTGDV